MSKIAAVRAYKKIINEKETLIEKETLLDEQIQTREYIEETLIRSGVVFFNLHPTEKATSRLA